MTKLDYSGENIHLLDLAIFCFFPDDIRKVLSECNTKCIFTISALVPKIKEALKGLETIQV